MPTVLRRLLRAVGWAALATVVPLGTGSCDSPTGADSSKSFSFLIEPDTVASGDSFAVLYTLRNPTTDTMRVQFGTSCFITPSVYRSDSQVVMKGTDFACLQEIVVV